MPLDLPHCGEENKERQEKAKKLGGKLPQLKNRFELMRMNFEDMIGKNAGNCVYDQRMYFDKIMLKWKPELMETKEIKSRVLDDNEECDVVSVLEESTLNKGVKEDYRLNKLRIKFAQFYMQSAWTDYVFINELKKNKVLADSNQNADSFARINNAIENCVKKTETLIVSLIVSLINQN